MPELVLPKRANLIKLQDKDIKSTSSSSNSEHLQFSLVNSRMAYYSVLYFEVLDTVLSKK